MKNIILLFLLYLSCNISAQVISFSDTNFKNCLMNTPCVDTDGDGSGNRDADLNNDGEIDQSEALSVTRLRIGGFQIQSLTEISYFSNIKVLICFNNTISTLNVSSLTHLDTLDCHSDHISNLILTGLTNLTHLNCNSNLISNLNLSGLSNLKTLSCTYNQLMTLNLSGLTNLTTLICSYNGLTNLDVSDLVNLEALDCSDNGIMSLDVSMSPNLTTLICQYNNLTSLNISGLTNIEILYCQYNILTSLDVSSLPNLNTLFCSYNSLTTLFIKNGANEGCSFINNPNLTFICCDTSQVQSIQTEVLNEGLTNCTVSTLCSYVPGGSFSPVQAEAIFDGNSNGCDALDSHFGQLVVNLSDGVNTGTLIADNDGYFAIPVQVGNYTLTPVLQNPNYFIITPISVQVTTPTNNSTLPPFCITANGIHHDLEITLLPTTPARPGFNATYDIVYTNKGNQIENGNLSLNFNDTVLAFLNSSVAPSLQSFGALTWNFSNLVPYQSQSISLTFSCNTPIEIPPMNVNDSLYFTSTITGAQADETPLDNTFDLAQVVVGSYDPNDKTCLEGDIITPEMVGDYVHYMIRFENTGTYAAENVAVSDVIDVSRFDISSLQITASSHSMKTRISNGNEVEFIFENINLPFDDANNDGYVAFKIQTLATLQLNDTLKNQANIYFDYNAPITTNEAQTVVQLPNGTLSLGFNSTTFNLFPNPAESILYIPADAQITQADIFDMKGALVRSVSVRNNQIEVQGLSSGTYFTRLYSDAKLYSAKFMVK